MNTKSLTPDDLAARGRALYGARWQTALAADLGVADRTMRRWLMGESSIPLGLDDELRRLLAERLQLIGGLVPFSINPADGTVFHNPTGACFRIGEGDVLHPLSHGLAAMDERDLIAAGAAEALRQQRERDQRGYVGRFVWAGQRLT